MDHRTPTFFQRPDQLPFPLHVVTTVFNAHRWRTRWKLYEDFALMVARSGAILTTVEVAFGQRSFAVTTQDNPRHVQLRVDAIGENDIWLKEVATNVGVSRLPADWARVAWIDSDVLFVRPDWANECLHALEHYSMVQMWSAYQDMTIDHELIGTRRSFLAGVADGWFESADASCRDEGYGSKVSPGAPGLAWAARRDAWDQLDGGLLDVSILGAGDWYAAHGLVGQMDRVVKADWHPRYREIMLQWQDRAQALKRNVGVMKGLALHYWHGPKVQRKYGVRERLLAECQYNPDTDLRRDWQGLYLLNVTNDRQRRLRDGIRDYFNQRNEDATY